MERGSRVNGIGVRPKLGLAILVFASSLLAATLYFFVPFNWLSYWVNTPQRGGCSIFPTSLEVPEIVLLKREFIVQVTVRNSSSESVCEVEGALSAPEFVVEEEQFAPVWLRPRESVPLTWHLFPKRPGKAPIKIEVGSWTLNRVIAVVPYSLRLPDAGIVTAIVTYLLGGWLSVPWWVERWRNRRARAKHRTTVTLILAGVLFLRSAPSAFAEASPVSSVNNSVGGSCVEQIQDAAKLLQTAVSERKNGRYEQAVAEAEAAIAVADRLRTEGTGSCAQAGSKFLHLGYMSLGTWAAVRNQHHDAQTFLVRALELARNDGRRDWEIEALISLASSLEATADYDGALNRLEEADSLLGQTGDKAERLKVLEERASILEAGGRIAEAEEYNEQSLSLAKELLGNQGLSERKRAYLEKQVVSLLYALATQQLWEPANCATAIDKAKRISGELANAADAIQDKRYQARALELKGILAGVIGGDYSTALQRLEEGWRLEQAHEYKQGEIRAPVSEAGSLVLLSEAAASADQMDKAVEYAQQGLDMMRGSANPVDEATPLTALGRALYLAGKYEAAEKALLEGLGLWSAVQDQYPPGSPEHAAMSAMFFDSYHV